MIRLYRYYCYRKCTKLLDLQFCNKLVQKNIWLQHNWCKRDDTFDKGNFQGDELITETAHLLKPISSYKVQQCCVEIKQP